MASLFVLTLIVINCLVVIPASTAARRVTLDLEGSVSPVYTPIYQNGTINLEVIEIYAKFLYAYGYNGVLLFGSTGECDKFSVSEKKQILDAWISATDSLPLGIVVQVGAIAFPDVLELAKYAENTNKVKAIMALPELFYRPDTVTKLVYFMLRISRAAPNTALLYYHTPDDTDVDVDMVDFCYEARRRVRTFSGLKVDDFEVVLKLRTKVAKDTRIFVANSRYLAPALFMGFTNFIISEMNYFPKLVQDIIDAGKRSDLKRTRDLYEKLQDYKNAIIEGRDELAAQKAAMKLITDVDVGQVRDPDMPLTRYELRQLESSLRRKRIRLNGAGA